MSKKIKLDLADLADKLERGTLTATERGRLAAALRDGGARTGFIRVRLGCRKL